MVSSFIHHPAEELAHKLVCLVIIVRNLFPGKRHLNLTFHPDPDNFLIKRMLQIKVHFEIHLREESSERKRFTEDEISGLGAKHK
ncbi:MAG: hypothetical protein D6748_04680 [Calditrichaeota bacterium]|nr:MAG: hypothetical protein D6748_04680 [Calditrichota bacterium]